MKKRNLKCLVATLIAMAITTPVLANMCSPFDVTVPNQLGGVSFGGDALLMRATASNLGYGANIFSTSQTLSDVDTSYQWGAFDTMLGYRIPGTGNDILLSWTHMNSFNNSDNKNYPVIITIGSTSFPNVNTISGSIDFDYDAVDLDLGQRVNFGDYFNFRMFAGVRWANVRDNFDNSSNFIIDEGIGTAATYQDNDSQFKGAGPQIGFDGRYCLGYGFGVDANVTASLLVGDINDDSYINTLTTAGPIIETGSNTNLDNDNNHRVVPALDASLGLDYTFAFDNCDRSYLTIQAGYKVINYYDVVQNSVNQAPIVPSFGTGFTLGNGNNTIAFDGPYAGIKVNL